MLSPVILKPSIANLSSSGALLNLLQSNHHFLNLNKRKSTLLPVHLNHLPNEPLLRKMSTVPRKPPSLQTRALPSSQVLTWISTLLNLPMALSVAALDGHPWPQMILTSRFLCLTTYPHLWYLILRRIWGSVMSFALLFALDLDMFLVGPRPGSDGAVHLFSWWLLLPLISFDTTYILHGPSIVPSHPLPIRSKIAV